MSVEKSPNIYQRLHAVMGDVGYVQKEEKMVNNQYRFVSHDGVTAAVRPSLLTHGIVALPQNLVFKQDGNRTEVSLDIDFVNIDDPKDRVSVPSFGYGIDTQDKGPGKAISYAVKYALLKALGLETGDDPERDSVDHKPDEKKEFTREDKKAQRDMGYDLALAKTIEDVDAVLSWYDPAPDFIKDTAENKKIGISNGVLFPPASYRFIDVEEALDFGTLAKKNIEEGPLEGLEEWMSENDAKIKGLDGMLKAAKYNKGGKPSERLFKAYEDRTKTLAAE